MTNIIQANKYVLLFLFAAAILLRAGGLSHDLHLDGVYHPDTPKQVRAVEEFLRGDYMVLHDHPDYDGYPFFNSHLVEYIVRASMAVETAWQKHTGAYTGPAEIPNTNEIFWIMRTWNAFMSALAIPLIFLIGIRFSRSTAWAASILLLLSPLDINSCHYAANDTAAAFFALGALWFGFRIMETGRYRDLFGGALCVGAAFSSKYHGAMGVLPVLIGLSFYCKNNGGFSSKPSIARWTSLFFMGIGAVVVTSPGLLIYPERALKDILGFFEYTANFALPAGFKELSLPERMLAGWEANLPVLLHYVTIPAAVGTAIALLGVWRDKRIWLVLSVPLLHIIVGVTGKPHLHTAHHLPAISYVFLAAGIGYFNTRMALPLSRKMLGTVATAWAVAIAVPQTHREIFFFKHNDTRRITREWVENSMPKNVSWNTGRYTFTPAPVIDSHSLNVKCLIRSGQPPSVSDVYNPWFTLSLEDEKPSIFRNRDIYVFIDNNALLKPSFTLPFSLPLPDESPGSLLPLDLPWIGRTPFSFDVSRGCPKSVDTYTTQSLDRAWVVIQTGSSAAKVKAHFGGRSAAWNLGAGSCEIWEINNPHPHLPSSGSRYFYTWGAEAEWGTARVILFTDAARAGLWAFQRNDFEAAARLLKDQTERHPLYAAAYEVSASSSDAARRKKLSDILSGALESPETWLSFFGIANEFLDQIPYISFTQFNWSRQASELTTNMMDNAAVTGWFSPPVLVEAGHYQIQTEAGSQTSYIIYDACGRITHEGMTDSDSGRASIQITAPAESFYVYIPDSDAAPKMFAIRPDSEAFIRELSTWLTDESKRPEQIKRTDGNFKALAHFANRIDLINFESKTGELTPGESFKYRLDWRLPDKIRQPHRVAAWVHLVAEDGQIIAQDDHPLFASLNTIFPDPRSDSPCMRELELPASIAPGTYTLKAGLWLPNRRYRIKVKESSFDHGHKEILLKTFAVPDSRAQ